MVNQRLLIILVLIFSPFVAIADEIGFGFDDWNGLAAPEEPTEPTASDAEDASLLDMFLDLFEPESDQ